MNQDQLIQALVTHLVPEEVIEAKRNGTMFSYYVTLAQRIMGNNTQTQTTQRPTRTVRTAPAVDLNETEREDETPTRETARPARTERVERPATRAPRQNAEDRVRVRAL